MRGWGWARLGVVLGATTHLVWDDFTHDGRWAVSRIGWLHTEHAGILGAQWAQAASGVVGGVLVLVGCGRLLVTATPGTGVGRVTAAQRWRAGAAVVAAAAVGAAFGALSGRGPGVEVLLFRAVTRGGALAAGVSLLVCLAWWLRRPRRPSVGRLASSAAARR